MKREAIAVLLLLLLITGAWMNLKKLDTLMFCMEERLISSQTEARTGEADRAEREMRDALDLWLRSDGYTHIFIRHSEIDAISDAFYELAEALSDGDAEAAYEKLLYHLESVRDIEHLSLRSIF